MPTYAAPTDVVNIFDTDGHFLKRFATGGALLNPWGIAQAPAYFGKFSNALLLRRNRLRSRSRSGNPAGRSAPGKRARG